MLRDPRQDTFKLHRKGEDTLRFMLRFLAEPLADPHVTEVTINRPGEFLVEKRSEWKTYYDPGLTFDVLEYIAWLAAAMTGQDVGPDNPVCASVLPDGQRIHIIVPPAVPNGTVSLTIRRPPGFRPTLDYLEEYGAFRQYPGLAKKIRDAVLDRFNVLVAGWTGSGKTTLARAMIDCIPEDERLVTIEDTPEWCLDRPNLVSLNYSDAGLNTSSVDSESLFAAALRMRPDRVLLQELRQGGPVSSYMRSLTQHPGGITTVHADSAAGAFDAMFLIARSSPASAGMQDATIHMMLRARIDLVLFCQKDQRRLTPPYQVTGLHERERADV